MTTDMSDIEAMAGDGGSQRTRYQRRGRGVTGAARSICAAVVMAALVVGQACTGDHAGAGSPDRASDPPPATTDDATMQNVKQVHNSDLSWDGNFVGLTPKIVNPNTAALLTAGPEIEPALIGLLDDPERFAAAHVVLTLRSKEQLQLDAGQWNGLHVTLEASGAVRYDERDMPTLREKWTAGRKLGGSAK